VSSPDPFDFLYSIDPPAGLGDAEHIRLARSGDVEGLARHLEEQQEDYGHDGWAQTLGEQANYHAQVAQRIRIGSEQYGDRSLTRQLTELLDEINEEAADIGGWAVIANAVAHRELDAGTCEAVVGQLKAATAAGMQAHAHIARAQALLQGTDGVQLL
jgi:hypothetical protein